MRAYLIRRVLLVIPTIFIVTILVFLSVRFIPGSVIEVMVARMGYEGGGAIDIAAAKSGLGSTSPFPCSTRGGSGTSSCVAPSAARCTAARAATPWRR